MKRLILLFIFIILSVSIYSCSLLTDPIDKKVGLSQSLKDTEDSIRDENWEEALKNLTAANKTWHKIKPLLQIDIDHDYVNGIEDNFARLSGFIQTESKPDSLAIIILIQETWENIGSL